MHKMQEIVDLIEAQKANLAEGLLFKWLSDEEVEGHRRLAFAPAMLYYLMGFKDVLSELKRENPTGPIDRAINAYCGEDAEHWRWYLTDLEKLGFSIRTWGDTIPQWCNEVWSDDTQVNRRTISRLIHYAKLNRHPLFAMTLIFVFEATGVVFIGHTRKAAIAMDMDDGLDYFGRLHFEEEFGHSVQARNLSHEELPDEVYILAIKAVSELFTDYSALFNCWYEHRHRYMYHDPSSTQETGSESPCLPTSHG